MTLLPPMRLRHCLVLVLLLCLAACGNKGDLVLPGPPPAGDGAAAAP